ncbi:hypothetical protein [Geotalea uraniireducens]|uniref:Type IV pilus assembly protein PilX n=1 Tax=Geotalea uraniireducens (strain Rf4) TaxID=351605 RepID=A5GEZ3_GEOUR|nr:hypothetical protein [Geotalea uraniireducens]ABQ25998.1 hypothetical protein Gura_1808 [Geotalea uraniireducens Rf4]
MRYLKNQNGIALVTALLLTLITVAVIMAVFYLLNQQTKTSAAEKVYSSALQAAYGDSELFIKDIIPSLFPNDALKNINYWENSFSAISLDVVATDACINDKLHNNTDKWTNCPQGSTTKLAYDMPDTTIVLRGLSENYKIYSKIVDTTVGNTDGSGLTERYTSGDGVTGKGAGVDPVRVPYLYTVEIQAEGAVNPKEKAQLEVLYAY